MKRHTVLVAGGGRGIGFSIAKFLLEKNLRVILLDRDEDQLLVAQKDLRKIGSQKDIEIQVLDLANISQIKEQVPTFELLQDGLFGLVCNAAVEILKPAVDFTLEELELTWKVNVLASIQLIQACYPFLKADGGCIVQIGSTADSRHDANYSVYGASKAFMKSFVGHAAQEMGFDGVRINVVTPGATDTPLMQKFIQEGQWSTEHIEQFQKSIPVDQRFASTREIAEAVWFALSGPKYFHGEDLRIYGGQK